MAAFLQYFAVTLLALTAPVTNAGFTLPAGVAQSTSLNARSSLQASVESLFLEDTWVDTQIVAPAPAPCKSLDACGWNRTDWNKSMVAYADIVGSKHLLLSEETLQQPAAILEEDGSFAQKQLLEASAVQLSLLLEKSCTESGLRQCWRRVAQRATEGASSGPRELRPVTITFRESLGSRDMRSMPFVAQAPLVTSLKDFRLASA